MNEKREDPMTPTEFKERMLDIERKYGSFPDTYGCEEDFHVESDRLIIRLLRELGYDEGADIFDRNNKWYS